MSKLPVHVISIYVTIVLTTLTFSRCTPLTGNGNKLLLILLDGFKWDYMDLFGGNELVGFNRLRSEGSSVRQLTPAFPSLSFPNYYSLMTGLYVESHGMVDNYMYDEKHNENFKIGENPEQYHSYWWNDGEPLWITGKKQGKHSYFWYWCGCEVEIQNHRPDFCQEYLSSPNPSYQNFTDALNQAVAVLRNGSADIAGVYFEKVDDLGHKTGKGSDEVKAAIRTIDAELARIQTVLETTKFEGQTDGSMFDSVNMAIFSDHGMTNRVGGTADNKTAVIHLLDYVNTTDFIRAMGSSAGPILSIWPYPGQEEMLYNKLAGKNPNMDVYRKKDIPERYHVKNHYRIPEIYMVAKPGYVFLRGDARTLSNIGYHGYENTLTDMQGIFLARGPDFKKGGRIEQLKNIDLYAMFCNILNIVPSPNNGTVSNTCDLVVDPRTCSSTSGASNHYYVWSSFTSSAVLISFLLLVK